jgi:catechol 2,3-dioxygenase-like lactoylglutathione lyase family enzyme
MLKVKGIGGVFFRATDFKAMNEWYEKHLGLPVTEDGCAVFKWREHGNPLREQSTVWSAFPMDTSYFVKQDQQFMINYIVDSLDDFIAQLKSQGLEVDDQIEESEFGRFGWVYDPEGNRIELWEPPKG